MPSQEIVEPWPEPLPPPSRSTPRPVTPAPTPDLVRPPKPGSVADWALRSHCVDCAAEPGQWCFGFDISEKRARLRERAKELATANGRPERVHAASLLHRARVDAGRKARLREYHRLLGTDAAVRTPGWRPTWTPRTETKSWRRRERIAAKAAAEAERRAAFDEMLAKLDRKMAKLGVTR